MAAKHDFPPMTSGANFVQTDNGVFKVVAQTYSGCDTSREEAAQFARLFAAAPDMLAALKRALPVLLTADDASVPGLSERIKAAEAALRKAEDRS